MFTMVSAHMHGAQGHPADVYEQFWLVRSAGLGHSRAAEVVGITRKTGYLWLMACGGVRPRSRPVPSGRFLSLQERELIALGTVEGKSAAQIGRELGRATSTITRELKRNRRHGGKYYTPSNAHRQAALRARRPKTAKLKDHLELRTYVQDKLLLKWSPRQISKSLVKDFPDRPEMRVSPETIYQSLYVQSRGALRRELTACLRTGRAVRRPKRRADERRGRIPGMTNISERPAEVEDRAVPGHWESDLIIGKAGSSAIGTLVERTTRFVMLLHLPNGHGAVEVEHAMLAAIEQMPALLRGSITHDQGVELTNHANITLASGMQIYFCDPHSPWQRGSNENTNGLLRQYFPKGTDLSVHTADDLLHVTAELNDRPRETLGWRSPREALNELLVAITD
jgi:transposase, IS30 family